MRELPALPMHPTGLCTRLVVRDKAGQKYQQGKNSKASNSLDHWLSRSLLQFTSFRLVACRRSWLTADSGQRRHTCRTTSKRPHLFRFAEMPLAIASVAFKAITEPKHTKLFHVLVEKVFG